MRHLSAAHLRLQTARKRRKPSCRYATGDTTSPLGAIATAHRRCFSSKTAGKRVQHHAERRTCRERRIRAQPGRPAGNTPAARLGAVYGKHNRSNRVTAPHQYLRPFFRSARKYTPTIHTVQQPLHHSTRTKGADLRPHTQRSTVSKKAKECHQAGTGVAGQTRRRDSRPHPGHAKATTPISPKPPIRTAPNNSKAKKPPRRLADRKIYLIFVPSNPNGLAPTLPRH